MPEQLTLHHLDQSEPPQQSSISSLPTDLLSQAAQRLRILALLYAFVFFMAGIFPMLVVPNDRVLLFSSPIQWAPAVVAIVMALVVALILTSKRLSLSAAMTIGLVFEVVSSYGIAVAELIDPRGLVPQASIMMAHGLSWVAVWTLLFTIVIPSRPTRAVLAALASVSAVPVTAVVLERLNLTLIALDPGQLFFWMIFPYLWVVCMAYVGARVIYGLTTEVKKARELGSYQLEQKLGQGGMGEVWKARHRLLARPAAIKRMRTQLPGDGASGLTPESLKRFQLEAQAISSLRSPHTVDLFDFGVDDDGSFYYVMELLEGLDTDKLIRRFGPVPSARAVHVLKQVCHSLSEAESRGLVHRDIKPANIFLCRYGEDFDFVKVLDFGIVKFTHDAPQSDPALTAANAVHGTPAFMAPEQATTDAIDSRADIYATGCVAYWLLTGKLVFEAPTAMGLVMHHARTIPVPPSTRTELPIPPDLDQLILSCLEKDPARRPQSAKELARRLEELKVDPWSQDTARKWWETTQAAS